MTKKIMDEHYEYLTRLYLRLKGFVVTNLILHSEEKGNSKSELDIVAIRMPFHSQEYRIVNVKDYLASSHDRIEILLADVKNYKKRDNVKFNKGLRSDRQSIKQLVEWLGIYQNVNDDIVNKFESFFNLHRQAKWLDFASFVEDLPLGRFNFKFTFFCPSLSKWDSIGFKYVDGEEILDFIWECLNDSKEIATCSRSYNFSGWNELKKYVLFFKGKQQKVSINEFEEYCRKLK